MTKPPSASRADDSFDFIELFLLDAFLAAMQKLIDRGVRQFKFVDRTFNLNLNFSRAILEFCLERYRPGLFFHFEMIPDRLPDALRQIIARFPPGAWSCCARSRPSAATH